jgi:outer membrane protein OmpA-like peptidoglycan-associated protein
MSKRELIFLLLGFWVIACLTWFYFISKGDDRSGKKDNKASVVSSASYTTALADTPTKTSEEDKPDTTAITNMANDTPTEQQVTPVVPVTDTVSINKQEKTQKPTDAPLQQGGDIPLVTPDTSNHTITSVGTCYFNYNSAKKITYRNFSKRLLKKLSLKLKEADSKIVVTGHSDNVGSKEYNSQLGLERAEKVKQYLIKKGVPADMIEVSSKGETDPVTSNQSPEGRARNRRVEITIIS